MKQKSKKIQLDTLSLKVVFDVSQAAFHVYQKKSGTSWIMDSKKSEDLVLKRFSQEEFAISLRDAQTQEYALLSPIEARIRYANFRGLDSSLSLTLLLSLQDSELSIEISINDADPRYTFDSLYFPRSFLLPKSKENYWLFPFGGGGLIPATYRGDSDQRLGWKPSLKCFGAVQKKSAFLCLWETPWDTYLGVSHDRQDGPKLFPRFLASLNRFGYNRKLHFVFREKSDYVDLIRNVYKPWAKRRGYHKTLEEKTRENPKIRNLAGGVIFHQLIARVTRRNFDYQYVSFEHAAKVFEQIVKKTRIRNGCYHLDGWGRQGYDSLHPDVFPPFEPSGGTQGLRNLSQRVKNLGFHFGLHDNYLLFFPDAERYRDRHAVWGPDLEPVRDQFRSGGMNLILSPTAAREMIIANYVTGQNVFRRRWKPGKIYNLEFCYFDQFLLSGGGVEEDFNPQHRLNREQFIMGLLENIRIMSHQVGCITSSEHIYDFGVPAYDLNGNDDGLSMLDPKPDIIPAPLWNLAFHECLVVSETSCTPSKLASAGLLGAVIHCRAGGHGDHFFKDDASIQKAVREIQIAEPIRQLHREVMYRECTGSRILNADGTRQEIDYGDICVSGDLTQGTIEISGAKHIKGKFSFNS